MPRELVGTAIHALARRLFPICRSITGHGIEETLAILSELVPLTIHRVPTGTTVFDWTIPKEWNIRDAYIIDPSGKKILDFKKNNLHVVGYSTPVDTVITLAELQSHLYSLESQPDAIPYVTSYYEPRWGFCLEHRQRMLLHEGNYRVFIDSSLEDGHLCYGELVLPGKCDSEVFLSTYICHPSMANNELSGPTVTAFLAKWLAEIQRKYTYRLVFIPETIGSVTYLSRNLKHLKEKVIAGFNISCVGDDRAYSYIPSRTGNTLADRAALSILSFEHPDFRRYTFLDRQGDERQYCSPGVDLPLVTLCRSKFGTFPEYHTSLDDLNLVTSNGLQGGYDLLVDILELIERNECYRVTCFCEPQLGRRALYPSLSQKGSSFGVQDMMNFLAYADGTTDLIEIAETIGVSPLRLYPIVTQLQKEGLVS